MRHGDAPMAFGGDDKRELSVSGAAEVEITAHYIKSNYKIDHIICSTATRNKQTLDILQKYIAVDLAEFSDDIYKNDVSVLQSLVSEVEDKADTILLLGHNPSLLLFALKCDPKGYDEWHDQISCGLSAAEIIVVECSEYNTWEKFVIFGGKIKDIFIP
jgi:phosphohistidine phosphatase SixA